jgi:hypothetical protein
MSEDGEDPAVIVGGERKLELREDVGDVGLDRLSRHRSRIADRLVRSPFRHQGQDFALALCQVVERDSRTSADGRMPPRGEVSQSD